MVERVANALVKHWRLEANRLIRLTAQVSVSCRKPKKVSVTDHTVLPNTVSNQDRKGRRSIHWPAPFWTSHTTPVMGRHCQ